MLRIAVLQVERPTAGTRIYIRRQDITLAVDAVKFGKHLNSRPVNLESTIALIYRRFGMLPGFQIFLEVGVVKSMRCWENNWYALAPRKRSNVTFPEALQY